MKSPARKSRTTEEDVLTVGNDDMFVVRVFFFNGVSSSRKSLESLKERRKEEKNHSFFREYISQ
tara:strand:- start:1058 stop:1249 length:192 start_codon:yes stop_codon:yes gene_type:complete